MTSCFSPSRPGVGAGKCSTYCVESNSSASVILPLPMTSAYRRRTSALLSSVDIEKPPSLELIASRQQQQPYSLNIVFYPMGAVAHGSVPGSPPNRPIRPANEIYNAKLSISFVSRLRGGLCLFSPAPNGS